MGACLARLLLFWGVLFWAICCADGADVDVVDSWSGKIRDASLRVLEPESGFISDTKVWKNLWAAWRPGKGLPSVDFREELILGGTVAGPNLVILWPTVNDSGSVNLAVAGTKIAGPGFGYKLVKVRRKDLWSINGIPLDKDERR